MNVPQTMRLLPTLGLTLFLGSCIFDEPTRAVNYEWTPVNATSPEGFRFLKTRFASPARGFALATNAWCSLGTGCSGGPINLSSTDSGRTWSPMTLPPPFAVAADFSLPTPTVGYACALGAFGKTTDGGATWIATAAVGGDEVHFLDADRGWMVKRARSGSRDTLFKTSDGGATWSAQALEAETTLRDFQLLDSSTAIGSDFHSTLRRTTDGGETWSRPNLPTGVLSSQLYFQNSKKGWLWGTGTEDSSELLITLDGGASWSRVSTLPATGTTLVFLDNRTGFATGIVSEEVNGQTQSVGVVYETRDGGKTWQQMELGVLTASISLTTVGNTAWMLAAAKPTWKLTAR